MGGGRWVVCKPILVFYFGPNQALGLGLRLGPSRTKTQARRILQLGNYSLGLSPDQLATCRDDSQLSEWVTSCHNLNELGEKLNFTGFKLYKMICWWNWKINTLYTRIYSSGTGNGKNQSITLDILNLRSNLMHQSINRLEVTAQTLDMSR